jgi:hypothetical protein
MIGNVRLWTLRFGIRAGGRVAARKIDSHFMKADRVRICRLFAAMGLLALSSCSTHRAGLTSSAVVPLTRAPTGEIRWLTTHAILEDFTFPPEECRQKFVVMGEDLVWHVDFPAATYSFGAISFRKSSDFSIARERLRLLLRIRPATAASMLRAGLVDGHGVLVDVPASRSERNDGDWETIDIPLTSFPARGIVTAGGAATQMAIFDWSAVREFRLISDGRLHDAHVVAGQLRISKD